jgi:hypothetical protein
MIRLAEVLLHNPLEFSFLGQEIQRKIKGSNHIVLPATMLDFQLT